MRKTTNRINFTVRALEALPTPKEKRAIHYDTQVRGLGIMVQPSGHRSFFWFRKVHGYPTWKTIGPFPDLSIEQARKHASRYSGEIADWKASGYEGASPFDQQGTPTLGSVLEDYLERHLKAKSKSPDRAVKDTRQSFQRHLSTWRNRTLGSIRREHVRALHAKVGEDHGHYSANRIVGTVRTLYSWADKTEVWHGENPAKGIEMFHEEKRGRFTQPDELPRLFKELQTEKNLDLRDFVLLALTTGARRSNLLAMRWEQLDLTSGLWTIPEPKNREPYIIPLVTEAVALLKARRRRVTSEWVFPSRSKSGHLAGVKKAWKKLLTRAKIENLRIHDLRRTLGSWQAGAGVSLPIIGKTLGHQSGEATEVYARLHLDPVRDAINVATRAIFAAGKVNKQKLLEASRG